MRQRRRLLEPDEERQRVPPPSAPSKPARTPRRPSSGTRGTRSGRPHSGCTRASPCTGRAARFVRPLSRMTTCISSGPSCSPDRRGPVISVVYDGQLLPRRRYAPAASAARRGRRVVGTSRSIPMSATCTRGSERDEPAVALVRDEADRSGRGDAEVRAGDADVGVQERLAKLSARGLRQRLQLGRNRASPRPRDSSSATCSAVFSIAGATMCTGCSPASWRMYSPRSVSTGVTPTASRAVVEADLLGRHRLRLRRELRARAAADVRRRTRSPRPRCARRRRGRRGPRART